MSLQRRSYESGFGSAYKPETEQHLIFDENFKEFLNRKNIRGFLNIVRKHSAEYDGGFSDEAEGVKVVAQPELGKHKTNPESGHFYKVEIKNNPFFVKEVPAYFGHMYGGGVEEVEASFDAAGLLRGQENVKVASYKFAYQDRDKRYLVSEWNDRLTTTLDVFIEQLSLELSRLKQNSPELREKRLLLLNLNRRKEAIKDALASFYDMDDDYNMAYDPEYGTIYVFDLNLVRNRPEAKKTA